jgi:spore maturation protein CgeB
MLDLAGRRMKIAILGLSITSSWGNGHATTYRALARALTERAHQVHFFERDVEWYAHHRDLPESSVWHTTLYDSLDALHHYQDVVRTADVVVVGSYVPDGPAVIDWVMETATGVRAFYDIDTPVTLEALSDDTCAYITRAQIPELDLYLSFSGGRSLTRLVDEFGACLARPLYCAVDELRYRPTGEPPHWHLGYLGTYSADRQLALNVRLLEPARRWPRGRFVVAGPQFPRELDWPPNVERIEHLPPPAHPSFYCSQCFTLNVTRSAMVDAGHSPSVRLFEAAACGTPIISDDWTGLHEFFEPGNEILVSGSTEETLEYLCGLSADARDVIATRARTRVLASHTAARRAEQFEQHVSDARD